MVYHAFSVKRVVRDFEVDSTESVWYRKKIYSGADAYILKLTPQSQYGILHRHRHLLRRHFEVDSTESVWYILCGESPRSYAHFEVDSTESVWYNC